MIYTGGALGSKYENLYWYRDDPDYNPEIADKAVAWFSRYLTHTKGRWAGQPFDLFEWQEHRIIRPIFGILKEKPSKTYPRGIRRIRMGYFELPKKNGKSELGAGIGNKLFRADGENAAEVCSAAADREQASQIHGVAAQMIRNNDLLGQGVQIKDSIKRIIFKKTNSYFEALSADVPTKHGLNLHACLFDELHAQSTSALWDVLTEGSMVARVQPLLLSFTTAGWDRESVCWKQRNYAHRVMMGIIDDPEFLPVIYGMDDDEDWENEDNWWAVNPSMDKIFKFDDFKKDFQRAKEMPYKINLWRRLRLNQWTRQETRFIPMDVWDKYGAAPVWAESLRGRPCYVGGDLSTTTDIAVMAYCFPMDNGDFKFLWDFYMPADNIEKRVHRDKVPYDEWVREGYIKTTPGNVIDYNFIKQDARDNNAKYNFLEVGYDPWNASQFVTDMQNEGFQMIPVRQGFASMSAPTKDFLKLLLAGKIHHGGNSVIRWMADNTVIKTDAAGNIKPDKAKSTEKIDGIVAAIIALDCATRHQSEHGPSVYEERGLITL